ncbi:MAG TPA: Ig-like domain-containing protein [Prosthecobacter sp.]|nr:Ig-like domain-containing protein [Prosthecobacter sp.]
MGSTKHQADRLVFIPALPFIPGQSYRAQWRSATGPVTADFAHTTPKRTTPGVHLTPEASLPANALKLYLHFTEPMEQGVFLERLRLLDAQGREVIGPFRETELWAPDGQRLTVWFHPGRQKAGVNLNFEEGPVLHPNSRYTLVVSGIWRSSAGAALGQDHKFTFDTREADHDCPQVAKWKVLPPKAATRRPLRLQFDEALDGAMLKTALQVLDARSVSVPGTVDVAPSGAAWHFTPAQPWAPGEYQITANPDLEDLAGNSLTKPFEVDLSAPAPAAASVTIRWVVEP